jgi:SnoaL-like polyketide cyclase
MTPEFYDHDDPGGKPTDVDGDEQMMVAMYKSMPDLDLTIEDMLAERDKVMCRNAGDGPISHRAKRCCFVALCCGASRERSSPSVGPQSFLQSRKLRRQLFTNRAVEFRISGAKHYERSNSIELGPEPDLS